MTRRRLATLALVLAGAAGLAAPLVLAFGGLATSTDGALLPGGASLVRDGMVNAYVVPTGDGHALLVDCGADTAASAVERARAARGLHDEDVIAILLTHGHRDHLGGCRRFSRARVFAHGAERDTIEGRRKARGPVPRLRAAADDLGVRVSDAVEDGAAFRVGELPVECFHVPGHTEGSAAWLIGDVLYMGDSAALEAGGSLRPAAWIFSDDTARNRRALAALARRLSVRDRQPRAIAFGHSGPAGSIAPLIAMRGDAP
jgi:glyoxylase-like metal-dependent hydrolase (beta-lactamase superfamily II)